MKKTTLITTASLLILVLAACGGSSDQTLSEPAPTTQAPTQPTVAPAAESPATEAPATNAPTAETSVSVSVSYASQIKPIFDNKCINCHGVDSVKEGLDMRTYDSLMTGSFGGAAIIPNDANNSLTVQKIAEGKMPKRGAKVTPEELQLIIDWINQGAQNN